MLDLNVLISKSKDYGFENIEIIEKSGNSLNIKLFDGHVDKNVISQIKSFSVRAIYNGKMANINVEVLTNYMFLVLGHFQIFCQFIELF
jgi:predicted Zn-dependent protease